MLSSASTDADPSNSHTSPVHSEVNCALGGWSSGGASPAGRSRIVNVVAVLLLAFAVAVSPPVVAGFPAASPAPGSVSRVPTRPPPAPAVVALVVSPTGAVHPVVALDLSAQ
jgi:hypothetical protein